MNDSPLISISAPTCSRNFTRSDSNPLVSRTRIVIMPFLVLPSLQLLDEEGEWDVLLVVHFCGDSRHWTEGSAKCTPALSLFHTCKCLFQSPLAEILPVGLQQPTHPEKFISVLGLMWDAWAVAAVSPRNLGISWFGFVLVIFWVVFFPFWFCDYHQLNLWVHWSICMQILKENAMLRWTWRNWKMLDSDLV